MSDRDRTYADTISPSDAPWTRTAPPRANVMGADMSGGAGERRGGDRDYGNSAGYGSGGSALDYHDVGDMAAGPSRPNPLDAVMTIPGRRSSGAGVDQERLARGLGWLGLGVGLGVAGAMMLDAMRARDPGRRARRKAGR